MSNHDVVLTVASYASDSAARRDFDAVVGSRHRTNLHVAVAILHKGPDGARSIDRSNGTELEVPLAGALLGAALTVLAAPVGIALLPRVVAAPAGWAVVTALVTHFWQYVPQNTLHMMSNLLEEGPAGAVMVTVDQSGENIRTLLPGASATIVTESTTTGLDVHLNRAIDEATDW